MKYDLNLVSFLSQGSKGSAGSDGRDGTNGNMVIISLFYWDHPKLHFT